MDRININIIGRNIGTKPSCEICQIALQYDKTAKNWVCVECGRRSQYGDPKEYKPTTDRNIVIADTSFDEEGSSMYPGIDTARPILGQIKSRGTKRMPSSIKNRLTLNADDKELQQRGFQIIDSVERSSDTTSVSRQRYNK